MAVSADIPCACGTLQTGAYVRIKVVDVAKKDPESGTFYCCAEIEAFTDATAEDEITPPVQRVKVSPLDLDSNPLVQLYTKLKADLTTLGIANVTDV